MSTPLKSEKISYQEEIAMMLFGFGDSNKPNEDTIKLVEGIVLNQLRIIIQEAFKYSDGNKLDGKALVFLMRRNRTKMQRFIRYLLAKELNKEVNTSNEEADTLHSTSIDVPKSKPKHPLIEFIEYMDETGELTDLSETDQGKYERTLRADEISKALDKNMYLEYQEARRQSFFKRSGAKFRKWLDPNGSIEFDSTALDVLAYYGRETIAQLTDYAFQVRLDSNRGSDPFSSMKVYYVKQAITVNEISEVMRRVSSPQTGKLNLGKKLPITQYILAL